jgi:membrane dipeptidase
VKVAGIDHVGIGSDFDGIPSVPEGMEDVSKLPAIPAELKRRGYSDADVKKIMGENFMRVFAEAEKVAKELQAAK